MRTNLSLYNGEINIRVPEATHNSTFDFVCAEFTIFFKPITDTEFMFFFLVFALKKNSDTIFAATYNHMNVTHFPCPLENIYPSRTIPGQYFMMDCTVFML